MKWNTLIIEDEEPARNIIKNYLMDFNNIHIIAELSDGFSGVKAINELKPDIIFLDIQMPRLNGFEVLELIEHKPAVIFTTAYDQYAIKAFEVNAIDYLLKPFSKERFSKAILKVLETLEKRKPHDNNMFIQTINNTEEKLHRIAVRTGNKIHVIPTENIIYIEAQGDYVSIHTQDDSFLKEKPMKYYENNLDNNNFVRIHRSYIVNINYIQGLEYYDKENYLAILKNKEKLKVSSNGYKILREKLKL